MMRRMASLTATLAATLVGVTACGHPMIPADAIRPPAPATVAATPSKPIMGVDLYAVSNYSAAKVTAYGNIMIPYIKNVLHADAVGIVWNFYSPGDSSNKIDPTAPKTLSASNVEILTKIAQSYKLRVEYRPEITVPSAPNTWQGRIYPTNQAAWFTSYYKALLPYLKIAQQLGVPEFVSANEMHKLNASPVWKLFFAKLRTVYHGVVSYTAWDEDYLPKAAHVLPVRALGTNMYRPLFLPSTATLTQVTAGWEKYFRQVPKTVLYRTAIDETGIAAKAGAYQHPGNLYQNSRDKRDEQVQVNWFLAACHTVLHYHMRGVYFWKVDLADDPAHPATSLSTFEGQKGATAISDCAKLLHV
jgi:Glycoside Hydrolase Family 113